VFADQNNGARLAFDMAELVIANSQARIDAAPAKVARIKAWVDERGASVSRRILEGQSLDEVDVSDATQLPARRQYAATQPGAELRRCTLRVCSRGAGPCACFAARSRARAHQPRELRSAGLCALGGVGGSRAH